MKLPTTTTLLAVLMATSVVLNGAHAKDLAAIQSPVDPNSANAVKVSLDLHPHVDKHFGKLSADTPQIDSRSLRLRYSKKPSLSMVRGWLAAWRDQLSLYVS